MRICNNCTNPVFGTDKKTKIGYCKGHQYLRTDLDKRSIAQKSIDKNKQVLKIRSLVNVNEVSAYKSLDDKLIDNEAAKRLKRLNIFFAECAIEIAKYPYCDNCGEWISPADYRNSTGHILPKGIFRSIETHPLCWVKVGNRCNCHNDTHRLDKFSKMRIFPKVVQQFRQIEHLITEKHKLLDEFRMYADLVLI